MSLRSTSSYAQKSTTSVQCLVVLFLNQAKTPSPPEMFFFSQKRHGLTLMKKPGYISNILFATVLPLHERA